MKKFLLALALSVISVSTLYAQAATEKPEVGKLPEPSALVLGIAGISAVALWLRTRR